MVSDFAPSSFLIFNLSFLIKKGVDCQSVDAFFYDKPVNDYFRVFTFCTTYSPICQPSSVPLMQAGV